MEILNDIIALLTKHLRCTSCHHKTGAQSVGVSGPPYWFYPLHTTHTDSRDKNNSSHSGVDSNSKLSQ